MSSDVLFTGERFVPGINDNKLEIEHYQRYLCAQKLVKGKIVLDAACGEGYGSNILAKYAQKVIGIDIDHESVARARKTYGQKSNLIFQQGNIENLDFADNSIDIIVSFETIEHVPENTQIKFLNEINRVLKKEGTLLMSTPNKKIYSDLYHYKNEFHVKEFYHDEFVQFLHAKFEFVRLFNQAFRVFSIIARCDRDDENISYYSKDTAYNSDGKYYIALASHHKINDITISSLYVDHMNEYEENIQRILTLQKEEANRNNHIKELDNELKQREEAIQELQQENNDRNGHIKKLDTELQLRNDAVQKLQQENNDRNNHIQNLDREIDKNREIIRELQLENSDRNNHIAHLDMIIAQNNNVIAQQKDMNESQLDQIVKQSELIAQQSERIIVQSEKIGRVIEQNIKQAEQVEQLSQVIRQKNQEIHDQANKEQTYEQKIAELLLSADTQKQEYEQKMAAACLPDETKKLEYEQKIADMRRFMSVRELELEELHRLASEREQELEKQTGEIKVLRQLTSEQRQELSALRQSTEAQEQKILNQQKSIEELHKISDLHRA